jgi:hypothetical protein
MLRRKISQNLTDVSEMLTASNIGQALEPRISSE